MQELSTLEIFIISGMVMMILALVFFLIPQKIYKRYIQSSAEMAAEVERRKQAAINRRRNDGSTR